MNNRRKITTGFVVGALFTVAPFFGLFGTDVAMHRMFRAVLASGMSYSWLSSIADILVVATGVAIILCPVGIIILIVSFTALVKTGRAKPSMDASPTI